MNNPPITKELILLGGGHAHVIVIRMWAMNPIEGVRVTLVSEQGLTPYSGMLPGLVAGHYSYSQSHIDLPRLCQWANVRFIEQRATGILPERQVVSLQSRPEIYYDYLSVDTGGAPSLHQVEGAPEFAVPVKPVATFYARWKQIEDRLRDNISESKLRIGVVGAGAGGFEILLAMHHRATEFIRTQSKSGEGKSHCPQFHWIIRGEVLPGASDRVRRFAIAECERKNIVLQRGMDVATVREGGIVAADGREIALDEVLWCTEAKAASWPGQSGLGCNDDGFIRLNDYLQSVSHENVFAAGDVAVLDNHPRPRAGVFAVRQGPLLFQNLRNFILSQPLKIHVPQSKFLTLLSLGHRGAIASRGGISVMGDWVWRWKDHIDQTFMNRFNNLPEMGNDDSLLTRIKRALIPTPRALPNDSASMRCSGCGSKVPGDILRDVLTNVGSTKRVASKIVSVDDVVLVQSGDKQVVQSIDQLRAMLDDPNLFARIATLHALSDLYASNAVPHSAMVSATLPFASELIVKSDLTQMMSGVVLELEKADCKLAGGHSSEGAELSLGLTVNGLINKQLVTKAGAQENQALILTKPLGIGVLLATHMQARLQAEDLSSVITVMLSSNKLASEIAFDSGATAMTDVTGFGLIGHLSEMMEQSASFCELWISKVPVLDTAHNLALAGQHSSLYSANSRYARCCVGDKAAELLDNHPLVFDPQTSGGLVFSLPKENAEKCVSQLVASGYHGASIVGEVLEMEFDGSPTGSREKHIRII